MRDAGRLDRDIGVFRQSQEVRHVGHCGGIFQRRCAAASAEMVDRQAKSGVTFGDPADLGE
jgi:hypothetical protein